MRSHCSPKTSSTVPTTRRSASIGRLRQRRARARRRSRPRRPSAAATPHPADRQPRVTPTASTIVSASTISTADARNAATNNRHAVHLNPLAWTSSFRAPLPLDHTRRGSDFYLARVTTTSRARPDGRGKPPARRRGLAASSRAPSMKLDLRRRRNGMPIRYIPGESTTPPSWRTMPLASSTGDVEPGVVGAEAGRPDDRLDRAAGEIEAERRRLGHDRRREPVRRRHRVVDAVGRRPLVDGVEQPAELEVGELALVAQRPGELRAAVADRRRAGRRASRRCSVSALRSSVARSGEPPSCIDGTRRARTMSSTSS